LEKAEWDNRFHVALDNCTDVSIFSNKRLLDNVHQSDNAWIIEGHKRGSEIKFDNEGTFMGMVVLYSEHASANVICENDLEEACETFKIPDWGVRAMWMRISMILF
jgi:hypothetical protein